MASPFELMVQQSQQYAADQAARDPYVGVSRNLDQTPLAFSNPWATLAASLAKNVVSGAAGEYGRQNMLENQQSAYNELAGLAAGNVVSPQLRTYAQPIEAALANEAYDYQMEEKKRRRQEAQGLFEKSLAFRADQEGRDTFMEALRGTPQYDYLMQYGQQGGGHGAGGYGARPGPQRDIPLSEAEDQSGLSVANINEPTLVDQISAEEERIYQNLLQRYGNRTKAGEEAGRRARALLDARLKAARDSAKGLAAGQVELNKMESLLGHLEAGTASAGVTGGPLPMVANAYEGGVSWLGKQLGIDTPEADRQVYGNTELANAAAIFNQLNRNPGAQSDRDLKFLLKAAPGADKPNAVNEGLKQHLQVAVERQRQYLDFMNWYIGEYGDSAKAQRYWNKYRDANPLFVDGKVNEDIVHWSEFDFPGRRKSLSDSETPRALRDEETALAAAQPPSGNPPVPPSSSQRGAALPPGADPAALAAVYGRSGAPPPPGYEDVTAPAPTQAVRDVAEGALGMGSQALDLMSFGAASPLLARAAAVPGYLGGEGGNWDELVSQNRGIINAAQQRLWKETPGLALAGSGASLVTTPWSMYGKAVSALPGGTKAVQTVRNLEQGGALGRAGANFAKFGAAGAAQGFSEGGGKETLGASIADRAERAVTTGLASGALGAGLSGLLSAGSAGGKWLGNHLKDFAKYFVREGLGITPKQVKEGLKKSHIYLDDAGNPIGVPTGKAIPENVAEAAEDAKLVQAISGKMDEYVATLEQNGVTAKLGANSAKNARIVETTLDSTQAKIQKEVAAADKIIRGMKRARPELSFEPYWDDIEKFVESTQFRGRNVAPTLKRELNHYKQIWEKSGKSFSDLQALKRQLSGLSKTVFTTDKPDLAALKQLQRHLYGVYKDATEGYYNYAMRVTGQKAKVGQLGKLNKLAEALHAVEGSMIQRGGRNAMEKTLGFFTPMGLINSFPMQKMRALRGAGGLVSGIPNELPSVAAPLGARSVGGVSLAPQAAEASEIPPAVLEQMSMAEETPKQSPYQDIAALIADQPPLIQAIIQAESSGNPTAIGPQTRYGKAVGLMQLIPSTAKELGVDPTDPVQNIEGGTRYINQMIEQFGDPWLALAAYNWGPGNMRRLLRDNKGATFDQIQAQLPKETRNYVNKIRDSLGGTVEA